MLRGLISQVRVTAYTPALPQTSGTQRSSFLIGTP
jgi:hypothetical protein